MYPTYYKRFQIAEDFLDVESVDSLDNREFITQLLDYSGCIYEEEIEAYLKCLRKEIELYRKGAPVMFDPNVWGDLMQIEKLFGISL